MRVEELAKTLDLVLLSPLATAADIELACDEAAALHLAAVTAYPAFAGDVAERLRGSDVKAGACVGLPFGADQPAALVASAERAVNAGARELDVVMNVPAFLSGRFSETRDDLARVVRAARAAAAGAGRGTVIVKVIIEAPLLGDKLTRLACRVVADAGADLAATGSGAGSPARPQDVELMRECLPGEIGVAASGGVATLDDALALIDAGAQRVGSALAVDIVREMTAAGRRR
ncbi:MAG: deoxyribose-phosphate aldolase [Actinomycetota bacterium]